MLLGARGFPLSLYNRYPQLWLSMITTHGHKQTNKQTAHAQVSTLTYWSRLSGKEAQVFIFAKRHRWLQRTAQAEPLHELYQIWVISFTPGAPTVTYKLMTSQNVHVKAWPCFSQPPDPYFQLLSDISPWRRCWRHFKLLSPARLTFSRAHSQFTPWPIMHLVSMLDIDIICISSFWLTRYIQPVTKPSEISLKSCLSDLILASELRFSFSFANFLQWFPNWYHGTSNTTTSGYLLNGY